MNKEEILAKSREENKNNKNLDPYEAEVNKKASSYGMLASMALCSVLYLVKMLAGDGQDMGLFAAIFTTTAVARLYKDIVTKNKNKRDIIFTASYVLIAALSAVAAFLQIFLW